MLLFVTGTRAAESPAAWPALAAARKHPRTGAPLVPAVTRLDLFLAAFAPSGVPAPEQWWHWVPGIRRALRELVRATFPPGPRYSAPFDPSGPRSAEPSPRETAHIRTATPELRGAPDPAQRPSDPRLWLVVAPPLPALLEEMLLATFLRAEPFARVARAPAEPGPLDAWLGGEVDRLVAGEGLAVAGLVTDLDGRAELSLTLDDGQGRVLARSDIFDSVAGLEDLYASKELLEPGEAYNRLHSHTGSEELYLLLEGEGTIRVNERVLPIKAGQCFGKPRGYGCSTQILNTGTRRMVFLDIGTNDTAEVDVCQYPEHGEVLARHGGQGWFVPSEAIRPRADLSALYENRYFRLMPR